jgi:hypothetical protein
VYSDPEGSSGWWYNNFMLSKGTDEPYYFIKHPVETEPVGCLEPMPYITDYRGNLISFTTPGGSNKQFPASPFSFSFYVNYGCRIYLDFLFTVPLMTPGNRACNDWLNLRLRGFNSPNLGTLTGDWYKNCPYANFDGYYCGGGVGVFSCEANAARLAAGTISEPYACEGISATSCCCATGYYAADLNPYSLYNDMKSYVCSADSFCCDYADPSCSGFELSPTCEGGSDPCSLDDPKNCYCGWSDAAPGDPARCAANYNNFPYVTIAASYQYTCDNLNGVEIKVILGTLENVTNSGSFYTWDINGNYDPYGDYVAGYNLYPGSWGYMTVECLGCSGCPEQAYCE